MSALKGQSLSLKCEAFGNLPITFQWFKQNEQIRPNERSLDERYQLEQISDSSANHLTAYLNISSLTRSDSVRFECRARNQFGGDIKYIDLIVKEPPEPPANLQLESASSRSLFIKWQSPFTGNSPITKYNILVSAIGSLSEQTVRAPETIEYKANNAEQRATGDQESNKFLSMLNQLISNGSGKNARSAASLDPSATGTHNHFSTLNGDYPPMTTNFTVLANLNSYVIRGLSPATNYSIRMQSINVIGESELSLPLFAATEEESPSEPPKNVQITVLNATAVLVTWSPPDARHCNGVLKGFYIGYKIKNSTIHYTYKTLQIDKSNADEHTLSSLIGSSVGTNGALSLSKSFNQHQLVLSRLKPYTEYGLILQAFNGVGAGPRSDETKFKTNQSAPSAAPSITKCTSPNSQTLALTWSKITADKLNGELAGYKIHYYTFDEPPPKSPIIADENQIIVDGNQNLIGHLFQTDNEINQNHAKYADQLINLSMMDRLPVRRTEHIPADQNETQLSNLNKFTNYTISIQAFTAAGDGPLSEFIFCQTAEDISDPPPAIKVVQTSSDSFYITWIAPKRTNGQLKSFTIYRKQVDQTDEEDTAQPNNNLYTFTVPKHVNYHRTSQLTAGSTYEFHVTATNGNGESEPSVRVRRTLNKNCPAEIINFNTIYTIYSGDNIEIACKAAGQPQPESEWLFNGSSLRSQAAAKTNMIHEHYSPNEQIFSSFLHLTNVQASDQGNYTCHSFNAHGHSYVTYQLHVRDLDTIDQLEYDDEPEEVDANKSLVDQANQLNGFANSSFSTITSPLIRLIKNNYDHIMIQWKVRNPFLLNSILAHEIFYRPVSSPISSPISSAASLVDANSEWKQFRLRNTLLDEQQQTVTAASSLAMTRQQLKSKLKRSKQITINGLNCGTNYQVYMILDTVFGKSTPSNVLNTRTLGREPVAANLVIFFSRLNSSTIKLNLDKWNDGGCSVFEYRVKWKQITVGRNNTQIAKKSAGFNKLIENQQLPINSQWNSINNVWHSNQPVYLTNLDANNQYKVRVEMKNSAGLTSMDYDLKVNAVPLIKPQSENTFRILSSSSSSYSNQDLDGGKNVDLIRSSTIGETDGQQINSQIIFLSTFVVLLFVIIIAVFAFFHRTLQQKLFYARSNRMLQLASDANSILSGPTAGSAINASDSVSNACLNLRKQHLNKLHQLNMDYPTGCPNNLTAELSVLRSNQQAVGQTGGLDPTYAKCLLKHQQAGNANAGTLTGQQHTTSLHNIESDNVYQSLTLARTNTDNLLSTFSKKVNQNTQQVMNPAEIYSVINKNRQGDQLAKTLKHTSSTFSKQPYEIIDHGDLEQQRYSIPNVKLAQSLNLANSGALGQQLASQLSSQLSNQLSNQLSSQSAGQLASQLHGQTGQITEQDLAKLEQYQQRLFETNAFEQELHNQFNLNDADALAKHPSNAKSLPKMFNHTGYEINNDCNCCTMPLENDCCTLNSAMNQLNTMNKHHWRTNNCDFSY